MNKTNDLIDFMHSLTIEMGREYERIQKRATEDAGTAGDQGEENWAAVFRNWLPADYQIVTKGRLLNEKGIASPQVDVIILHPFYPKKLLNKKLYFTAGVAAAFECKNTLKGSHIEKAIQNSIEIRNLIKINHSTYKDELNSPIIYGLIAHSHCWKGESSTPKENIQSKLIDADSKYVNHPRECLDFICVSDLASWSSYKLPMTMNLYKVEGKEYYNYIPGVKTAYGISHRDMFSDNSEAYKNFTPIGSFLSRLLKKLALTDKRLKDFSNYFGQTVGGGVHFNWRNWGEEILSTVARDDLRNNTKTYEHINFILDA